MLDFKRKIIKILTAKSIHIEESSMKEIQCNKNFNVVQTISRDSNVKNYCAPTEAVTGNYESYLKTKLRVVMQMLHVIG